MRTLAVCLILGACASETSASIPPCNAWIFLWGNANLHLDCPVPEPLKVLDQKKGK